MRRRAYYKSPIGFFLLEFDDNFLYRLDFTDDSFDKDESIIKETEKAKLESKAFAVSCVQLDEYFAGTRKNFDLPIKLEGTEFRMKCWEQLNMIPYAETISYVEMAVRIGNPKAMRAVGGANHNNPIAVIVPCHRVIGKDGSMTGFGGGLWRKVWLLEHEKKHINS